MPGRRLGILGGTFDPVHLGQWTGRRRAQALGLTEIVFGALERPPTSPQPITSAITGSRWSRSRTGTSGWRAADLELRSDAPSFTSRTLDGFHHRGYRPTELFFVIGADAFFEIESWRDYPNILDAAHFVVISRPGIPVRAVAARLPQLGARMVTGPADALTSNVP